MALMFKNYEFYVLIFAIFIFRYYKYQLYTKTGIINFKCRLIAQETTIEEMALGILDSEPHSKSRF
jgi:hypothetical protein